MEFYRIAKQVYQSDTVGTGAFLAGGRWNTSGNYLLYTAESRSLAILEVLVHMSSNRPVDDYSIAVFYLPDESFVKTLDSTRFPENWRETYHFTSVLGDDWLRSKEALIMKVPSAIVAGEFNLLINPAHPDFKKLTTLGYESFQFDERLFGHQK